MNTAAGPSAEVQLNQDSQLLGCRLNDRYRRRQPPSRMPAVNTHRTDAPSGTCECGRILGPGQDPAALAGKGHHHVPGSVVVAIRHHLLRTGNVMPRWIDGERQYEKEMERPRVSTTVDEEESTDGDEGWANSGE